MMLLLENKVVLSFLVSFVLAAFVILLRYFRRSNSVGNAIVLVGPSDAGKTAILSKLAYGQTMPSHTSIQPNTGVFTIPSSGKTIQLIDIPGHARLRGQLSDHIASAKLLLFVVDSSTISRNSEAVAEHLHWVLHEITSLPPSHQAPEIAIVAHKTDLLKGSSAVDSSAVAVNRVRTILERELEKRRQNQSHDMNIEGLGDEKEETSEWGGLECTNAKGTFQFSDWDGGEITFIPSCTRVDSPSQDDVGSLVQWVEENSA